MIKKFTLFNICVLALTLWFVASCRTTDESIDIAEAKYFKVFGAEHNASVSYSNGFAVLFQKFDSINLEKNRNFTPVSLHYAKRVSPLAKTVMPYIDFRFHSQPLKMDNGDTGMLFAVVENFSLKDIAIAILAENRTKVELKKIKAGTEFYEHIFPLFQQEFEKYRQRNVFSKSAEYTCTGCVEREIEEVTITKPIPKSYSYAEVYDYSNTQVGGDCGSFNDCYSGSGGSGGGSTTEAPNQKIIDELDGYPCAQELLKELPNLNNDLAKLLQETFGTNDNINITFNAKDGMGSVDGERSKVDTSNGQFNVTIDLNSDVLKNGTKEYILVTMYHEFIHAYIGYQVKTLTYEQYLLKFPKVTEYQVKNSYGEVFIKYSLDSTHRNYGPFIESMKNAILSFNPYLSTELALALAKYGVVADLSQYEHILNQNERNVNSNNYKGTKCQ